MLGVFNGVIGDKPGMLPSIPGVLPSMPPVSFMSSRLPGVLSSISFFEDSSWHTERLTDSCCLERSLIDTHGEAGIGDSSERLPSVDIKLLAESDLPKDSFDFRPSTRFRADLDMPSLASFDLRPGIASTAVVIFSLSTRFCRNEESDFCIELPDGVSCSAADGVLGRESVSGRETVRARSLKARFCSDGRSIVAAGVFGLDLKAAGVLGLDALLGRWSAGEKGVSDGRSIFDAGVFGLEARRLCSSEDGVHGREVGFQSEDKELRFNVGASEAGVLGLLLNASDTVLRFNVGASEAGVQGLLLNASETVLRFNVGASEAGVVGLDVFKHGRSAVGILFGGVKLWSLMGVSLEDP